MSRVLTFASMSYSHLLAGMVLWAALLALVGAAPEVARQQQASMGQEQINTTPDAPVSIDELLPKQRQLFKSDALDADAIDMMDCHMRNIDYCYAGVLGTMRSPLPTDDEQLETRCDEMRVAQACIAAYNKRCSTLKILAALAPYTAADGDAANMFSGAGGQAMQLPAQINDVITNQSNDTSVSLKDLAQICEPSAKGTPINLRLRARLFQVAKCVNQRMPSLRPCLEDLKSAIQLMYEPGKFLPMKPTCCAMARFRACAMQALDGVCGLSAFDELEQSFATGPASMVRSMQRICRMKAPLMGSQQSNAQEPAECADLLPPRGLRAPLRRGSRASKLAKALDLVQFAPTVNN